MLADIAPLADLLAAIGVIVSLVLVYIELKRGNRDARMSHWYKNMEAYREFYALSDDPLIAQIVVKGRSNIEQLSEKEYLVFDSYIRRCILSFNHFRRNTGHIVERKNEAHKVVTANLRRELDYPGIRTWWSSNRTKTPFAQSTIDWVDQALL